MGLQGEKDKENQKQDFKIYSKKFETDELEVLKKIYKELGSRSGSNYIDKETFLQFFPLPGLWGERLFLKFNFKNTGYIDFEEFIIGIAVCCRGTKNDKINVLFDVFDLNSDGYIQRSEMVAMLSNIPYLHKLKDIFFGNEKKRNEYEEKEDWYSSDDMNASHISRDRTHMKSSINGCDKCMREKEGLLSQQSSFSERTFQKKLSSGEKCEHKSMWNESSNEIGEPMIHAQDDKNNQKSDRLKKGKKEKESSASSIYKSASVGRGESTSVVLNEHKKDSKGETKKMVSNDHNISKGKIPLNQPASSSSESYSSMNTSSYMNIGDNLSLGMASEESQMDTSISSDSFVSIYGYLIKNRKRLKREKMGSKESNLTKEEKKKKAAVAVEGGEVPQQELEEEEVEEEMEEEEEDEEVEEDEEEEDEEDEDDIDESEEDGNYHVSRLSKMYELEKERKKEESEEDTLRREKGNGSHRGGVKKETKEKSNLDDFCLPSKTARTILHDEENNRKSEDIEVDEIVDKILEECEFLDNDKITLIQFKNIMYKYDFFLYIFFSCLHEELWGLQGNILYGRDYISNFVIKSENFKNDEFETSGSIITEELYFKIRQLFILQAPDYDCVQDNLSIQMLKRKSEKEEEQREREQEKNEEIKKKCKNDIMKNVCPHGKIINGEASPKGGEFITEENEKTEKSERTVDKMKNQEMTTKEDKAQMSKEENKEDNKIEKLQNTTLTNIQEIKEKLKITKKKMNESTNIMMEMENTKEKICVPTIMNRFKTKKNYEESSPPVEESSGCITIEKRKEKESNPTINVSTSFDLRNQITESIRKEKQMDAVLQTKVENSRIPVTNTTPTINNITTVIPTTTTTNAKNVLMTDHPQRFLIENVNMSATLNTKEQQVEGVMTSHVNNSVALSGNQLQNLYKCDFNLLTNSSNDIFSKEIVEFIQASKVSFNINDVCKERSQQNKAKYKKTRRNIGKVRNYPNCALNHHHKKKKKGLEKIMLEVSMKRDAKHKRVRNNALKDLLLNKSKEQAEAVQGTTLVTNNKSTGMEEKKSSTKEDKNKKEKCKKEKCKREKGRKEKENIKEEMEVEEKEPSMDVITNNNETIWTNHVEEATLKTEEMNAMTTPSSVVSIVENSKGGVVESTEKIKTCDLFNDQDKGVIILQNKEDEKNTTPKVVNNYRREDVWENAKVLEVVREETTEPVQPSTIMSNAREESNNAVALRNVEMNPMNSQVAVEGGGCCKVECEFCGSVSDDQKESLKEKRRRNESITNRRINDTYLYSCPNCKSPFLMCPSCHGRYPRFCVNENKIAMECEYCEDCYFYNCIYCNFDFQKCLDMIKKNSLKEGTLYKIGKHLHQFKARYYILFDNLLYYYDKKRNLKPRGFMFLEGCYVEVIPKTENVSKYGFSICHKGTKKIQKRNLYVNTYEEREEWLQALYSSTKQNALYNLYELHEPMGQGKFSTVYKGINKQTNAEFAIKVIDKRTVSIYEKELLRSEISILRLLRHPNVIYLKEIINTKETLYISMELVRGGELYDFLLTENRLSEMHANKIISQLIKTVAYLHRCGIIHRDIKPENILLTDKSRDAQIKLTDFGLSTLCAPNELLKEPCGTLAYVAPEVITLQGYNHKVDAWSIGIILYLVLSGRLPFPINKNSEMNIQKNYKLSFKDHVWRNISSSAKDLISKLLELNVEKRISVNEALEHIWIKNPTAVINENSVIYKNEEINILNLQDVSVSTFTIPKYKDTQNEEEKTQESNEHKKNRNVSMFNEYKKGICEEDVENNEEPIIPLPYSSAPQKETHIEKKKEETEKEKEKSFGEKQKMTSVETSVSSSNVVVTQLNEDQNENEKKEQVDKENNTNNGNIKKVISNENNNIKKENEKRKELEEESTLNT